MIALPRGLIIRREMTMSGYALRFSEPEARKGRLMDNVKDAVERLFVPKTFEVRAEARGSELYILFSIQTTPKLGRYRTRLSRFPEPEPSNAKA